MKQTEPHTRRAEAWLYAAVWLTVILVGLILDVRGRSMAGLTPLDSEVLLHSVMRPLPFLILFLVNDRVLIPRLLFTGRVRAYFLWCAAAVIAVWVFQYYRWIEYEACRQPERMMRFDEAGHPLPRPLLPLPLFLDSVFGLLTVGGNLAVALIFQHYRDRLESERLRKADAESRLSYLKAQINPHFYMNMLNNIHGMIDIDPAKAQEMLIDLSHLMRYMLYDSSQEMIGLNKEIEFLDNYLQIMRHRYPADRVTVTTRFPEREAAAGVKVAPLLFLVFVENAFKHGISYQSRSYVDVSVTLTDSDVVFECRNSVHPSSAAGRQGIGLQNVASRLQLLYGDRASLEIVPGQSDYTVTLRIPRS